MVAKFDTVTSFTHAKSWCPKFALLYEEKGIKYTKKKVINIYIVYTMIIKFDRLSRKG